MQIKQIDAAIIQEAVRIALRLAPPISGNFTLEANQNKLYLHSETDLSRCSVLLPCDMASDDMTFALPVDALREATRGRKQMTAVLDDSLLKIKSGKYAVALTTQDAIERDEDQRPSGATSFHLTYKQLTWLKSAVARVALKPTQNLTTFMPILIQFTDKSAFVCCVDDNHMMFTTTKTIVGDLDITLPLETVTALLDTFGTGDCELVVTNAALYANNPVAEVMLALPDTKEVVPAEIVREKAKEALRADGAVVELDKKEVKDFLYNARAVSDKSRLELQVHIEPDSALLAVKTTVGTAKTKLEATTKASCDFRIDLEYFEEALNKSKDSDTVKFKYVESFIVIYCSDAYSLISLNQED
jgi:hypothetical protein